MIKENKVYCDLCKKKLKTIFHGDEIEIDGKYYFVCMDCYKKNKKE